MINKPSKNSQRQLRHARIRKTLAGTGERPRLSVYRSNTGIYAQIIDDSKGVTLVASSSKVLKVGKTVAAAKQVGDDVAKKALAKGIKSVVFDRSGYLYHGRIKALADAAREAGLTF
ncbi:MAG: 50S ribosomal protein L18 [Bacilli bacterium]